MVVMEEQAVEKLREIRGDLVAAAWGTQIRSYVMHPYKLVKDLRTGFELSDVNTVLDGNLDPFVSAYLKMKSKGSDNDNPNGVNE